jgi:hypothetical protein
MVPPFNCGALKVLALGSGYFFEVVQSGTGKLGLLYASYGLCQGEFEPELKLECVSP